TSRSIFVNIGKINSVNRFTAPLPSMRHRVEQRCQAEYARCSQRVVLEPAHNKSIFLTPGTPRRLRKISSYRLPSQLPLCHTTRTITPMRRSKTVAPSPPRGITSALSVSQKFLAEHLGLSPATVSLVINRS